MTIRILVDCTFVVPNKNRGSQTYLDSLLVEMNQLSEADIICLTTTVNHRHYSEFLGLSCHSSNINGRNRFVRALTQQLFSGYFLKRSKCDVLFCPGALSPIFIRQPCVVTIHDLAYLDIPYAVPLVSRLLYRAILPFSVRRADKMITVSEFSKSRVLQLLNVPSNSVQTVYEGPLQRMDVAEKSWDSLVKKYKISGDVVLSVSSGLSHKNILLLIEAYLKFSERQASRDSCLVLIGHEATEEMSRLVEMSGRRHKVLFTGFVPDPVKISFLENSAAYVFCSLYEGFGLPVLEAQSCGLPLICSTAASLPEVAGNGARYFDPRSAEDLALKLADIFENDDLRKRLIEDGYKNAEKFSWSKAASETIAVCRSVIK